jgi:hypothetical protein
MGDRNISSPAERQYSFAPPWHLLPNRRVPRLKSLILDVLWTPFAALHLRRVAMRLQPQQIWALPYGWSIPATHRANLGQSFRMHVSIWDYVDNKGHRGLLGNERAEKFQRKLERLYSDAASVDVISKPMIKDLAQRTGRSDALIVHSGLERWDIERLARSTPASSSVIRIAYAGTIIAASAFEMVVRSMGTIRGKLTRPFVLEFFGGRNVQRHSWFDPGWMNDHPLMNETEFHEHLCQCTWGLIVMDLTDNDPRYNRFSFPNKFGTYLSAGLPLLVVGHSASSAAGVVGDCPVGVFTDASSASGLALFFENALTERHPQERFRSQILRAAAIEFNMEETRRRLWAALGVALADLSST